MKMNESLRDDFDGFAVKDVRPVKEVLEFHTLALAARPASFFAKTLLSKKETQTMKRFGLTNKKRTWLIEF